MTFHWIELLVVVIGGLLLLFGLALLVLRRRNEVLQVFLTPEQPDIEEEFFRVRTKTQEPVEETVSEEETAEPEPGETENVPGENDVHWGTQTQTPN